MKKNAKRIYPYIYAMTNLGDGTRSLHRLISLEGQNGTHQLRHLEVFNLDKLRDEINETGLYRYVYT